MRSVTAVLAPGTAGAALMWLAPLPQVLVGVRADAHLRGDPDAAVVHLVALASWLLVGWLVVATGSALCARLPGAVGRAGAAVSRSVTPALLRRAIGGTAALGIAVSPALVPSAALAAGCPAGQLPGLDRTAATCSPMPSSGPHPQSASHRPASMPPPATSPTPTALSAPVVQRTHTVVAGDTLWGLATAQLAASGHATTPARVAERWPVWWQANRAVIGADPDLIHVGAVLSVPVPLERNR